MAVEHFELLPEPSCFVDIHQTSPPWNLSNHATQFLKLQIEWPAGSSYARPQSQPLWESMQLLLVPNVPIENCKGVPSKVIHTQPANSPTRTLLIHAQFKRKSLSMPMSFAYQVITFNFLSILVYQCTYTTSLYTFNYLVMIHFSKFQECLKNVMLKLTASNIEYYCQQTSPIIS